MAQAHSTTIQQQYFKLVGMPEHIKRFESGVYIKPIEFIDVQSQGHISKAYMHNKLPYLAVYLGNSIIKLYAGINTVNELQDIVDKEHLAYDYFLCSYTL